MHIDWEGVSTVAFGLVTGFAFHGVRRFAILLLLGRKGYMRFGVLAFCVLRLTIEFNRSV